MEFASTAIGIIGLAGLFSTCIETLDTLSSAARYGINQEILQTKIEVERLRLRVWGESVGLTGIDPGCKDNEMDEDSLANLDESIQNPTLRPAVAGLLTCVAHYFDDIEELQKRHGLAPRYEDEAKDVPLAASAQKPTRGKLLSTFQKKYLRFYQRTAAAQKKASPVKKAVWAVTDERKFRALLTEIKTINDSLVSLLPDIGDKTRVRMRAKIMKSKDVGQLQSFVNAADDMTDLVAETASLRLEMLSSSSQSQTKPSAPRVVQITSAESQVSKTTSVGSYAPASQPRSAVENLIAASFDISLTSGSAPIGPPGDLYDDAGALVIHTAYSKPDCLECFSWLVGSGESPGESPDQPISHSAFELHFVPEAVLSIAGKFLETDVEADKKYAGWSAGSTSLTGFGREVSFWKSASKSDNKIEPRWSRTKSKVLSSQFVDQRWRKIVKDGLGEDFTDKKGYDKLRELIGPCEFTWLDPDENLKLRHQIVELLGAITSSVLPSPEEFGSIGLLAFYEQLDPNSKFQFVDFMRQILLAREAMLRIQRANRRWYGGITTRVIYDMIAADLWARHMLIKENPSQGYSASPAVVQRQLGGIIQFVDEMQWPYADEIRQAAIKLQKAKIHEINVDIRVSDWISGLVLPGSTFPLMTIAVLYCLSPTLRNHSSTEVVKARRGNYGMVYPKASFWCSRSVLGKVLAPLSLGSKSANPEIRCLGGWVGPCLSPSLPECVFGVLVSLSSHEPPFVGEQEKEVTQHKLPFTSNIKADGAPWILPTPPELSPGTATLQTMRLSEVPNPQKTAKDATNYSARLDFRLTLSRTFVTFTLYTNSVFIAAPPCHGTHRVDPHFAEKYTFDVRSLEELARVSRKGDSSANMAILVINAAGDPASEVFARAWCCHTGTNAVIWKRDGGECCFKCALMVASTEGLATGVLIST